MWFAIVAIFSAAAGAAIAWLFLRQDSAALAERVRIREAEAAKLAAELAEMRTEASRARADLARAETERDAGRQALAEAEARLTDAFKALSADALRTSRDDFLKLAQQSFAQLAQQSGIDLDKRQVAIAGLVQPLRESLEKVDRKMAELETSRVSDTRALAERLRELGTAQALLQAEAQKLSTALRSTTYAGSWGEFQLRRVVEMADMLPHCDFQEQLTSDAGGLRADLVVRLPGGQQIVVDAKAPLNAYRDAGTAIDEVTRVARLADHAAKVRSHIDLLGAKNYWEQFQPSPEFVVLFLPGDHFLTAALAADPTLLDRAVARKVLIATPTTLIALLKAAAYGWRQESISKNAEEVSRIGRELYDRVVTFADHLEKVGRGLEGAVKGYNQAVGSFEGALLPGARKFAELGAKGAKTLGEPAAVETGLREIARRE